MSQLQIANTGIATPVLTRKRLLDRIGLPTMAPVTLIVAPAGFGKTTLAQQWGQQAADEIVWIPIGPHHNDPDRFLRDLDAALPADDHTTPGALTGPVLAARLSDITRPVTIVMDDVHHITNDAVDRITRMSAGC